MDILKTKKFAGKGLYTQARAQLLMNSHKFSINVKDVFGEDFIFYGPQTWLGKMPNDLIPFLNLPHDIIYVEYQNCPIVIKNTSFGLMAWETPDGYIKIVPVISSNGVTSFPAVELMLGIKRELVASDFDFKDDYHAWLKDSLNKAKRFAIMDMSNGTLSKEAISGIASSVGLLLETLLYINAKGVGTVTNYPVIKKHIKRKSPLTDWTYKTLRLVKKGDEKHIHNRSNQKVPFAKRESREHTVRGHIAIYTQNAPLFGNPSNVGPIWKSPCIRNKGTEGKIIKNYSVD